MFRAATRLALSHTPDGVEIALCETDDGHYLIRAGVRELMHSGAHASEEHLGWLACERLAARAAPAVLIGGLGMGYTLRAALDVLPAAAVVTVVELVAAVATWNRGPLADLAGRPLDDPRVRLLVADVAGVLAASPGAFDAIVLDTDNGPGDVVRAANHGLYDAAGLATARAALAPGGVLALWSVDGVPGFVDALLAAGLEVQVHEVSATGAPGVSEHTLYLATPEAAHLPP
jgi:spermidine synthase